MAKPSLLCVDDDPDVLPAVQRDLRTSYSKDDRVVRASSGDEALETLRQMKRRDDPVALLLSDQRMPGLSGVAFLQRATRLYPDAKRVLLTAYADTDPRAWPLDRDPYLLESSVPGVFAVGDVRASPVKRAASAVGEGSIAVSFIHAYLAER